MESFAINPGVLNAPAGPLASDRGLAPWARLCEKAGRLLLGIAAAQAAAQKNRRTLLELQRLDAHMLRDIGLTPADVDLLAGMVPAAWMSEADWLRHS